MKPGECKRMGISSIMIWPNELKAALLSIKEIHKGHPPHGEGGCIMCGIAIDLDNAIGEGGWEIPED